MADIRNYGRDHFLDHYIVDGVEELDMQSSYFGDFSENLLCKNYTIVRYSEEHRPDLLSYRLYSTPEMWWVLLKLNGISDVWHDLVQGVTIKYPDSQYLKVFLSNQFKNNGVIDEVER